MTRSRPSGAPARATTEDLAELHQLLALELLGHFREARELGQKVPTAVLAVAERFLNDNSISAQNVKLEREQEEALREVLEGLPGAEEPFGSGE